MGRRSRQRDRAERLVAPTTDYTDPEGNVLTLRGALSPATRRQYAEVAGGSPTNDFVVGASQEDAWQRAVEFLFERLAVRWTIHEVPIEKQKELLARYRFASQDERRWIRDALREHLADWFPDMRAP